MMKAIRNLIKLCRVSVPNSDTGNFPVSQIEYWEKTSQAVELYPYGMASVAPEGCLGYVFSVQGQEENKFIIAFPNSDLRFKNLKPGETKFGNLLTSSYIYFKQDGSIEINAKTGLDVTLKGDVNLTTTGKINITTSGQEIDIKSSGKININANNVNLGNGSGTPIARQGDSIQVVVAGTPYNGTITSGSSNNRST